MNLVHNLGLELPIIPAETPILHDRTAYRDCVYGTDETTFVRSVELDGVPWSYNLKGHLRRTDSELRRLQETTGYPVVGHDWALYPSEFATDMAPARRKSSDHRVPKGYLLAAVVQKIKPAELPAEPDLALAKTHLEHLVRHRYLMDRMLSLRPRLYDICFRQYVYGTSLAESEQAGANPTFWMVDIEPRLSRVVFPDGQTISLS